MIIPRAIPRALQADKACFAGAARPPIDKIRVQIRPDAARSASPREREGLKAR